jgi:Subtilase family/Bacterial pre-peptidase C-terminal domain
MLPSTLSSLRYRNHLNTDYLSQQRSPWQLNTVQGLDEPSRSPSYTRASSSDQSRANSDFLQNAPADFLGDQFSTAYNIGNISGSFTFNWRGSVNGGTERDWYKFTLSNSSNFSLTLTELTADADVTLISLSEGAIAASQNPGDQSEAITKQLAPGIYIIQVSSYHDANTNYQLSFSNSGAGVDPGNSRDTALDMGEVSRTNSYKNGSVSATDPKDLYRFELRESTTINVTLSGLTRDADIRLLDIGGTVIDFSENSGTLSESINRILAPGIYYLDVSGFGGTTSYGLRIEGTKYNNPATNFNATYGYGLVNAAAAVAQARNLPVFANVPNLGGQNWGNDLVNAPEVWAQGYTGQGITVAVIDSGVDITHPDLSSNIWVNRREIANNGIDDDRNGYIDDVYGWNFGVGQNNNDVSPGTPYNDHGTHVAGTIAAVRNNIGVTGVAPNAKIMALRLGDVGESGSFVNAGSLATAIRYAVNNGARVINLSLGWTNSVELREALTYAASRNVIVISSAGNTSIDSPGNPGSYAIDYGITVGAVDLQRRIANFSNRAGTDSRMHYVVAPGLKIYSTLPGRRYGFMDGTSMAAPHVAGVVALMLSANPTLTSAQVRQILTRTATQLS